jgi:16S rRNA (adenine1518-N6/adenine1519-N6)-dimethyltransferase
VNLADPANLKSFLQRHGLWARKGLGQHFLVSAAVVDAIVSRASTCRGILEIGPGPGVLTAPLSEAAEKMIALEVDESMIVALKDSAPKAEVRRQDALEVDLRHLLDELPAPRAVVSNLPYYITGPLLTRIAEASDGFSLAVLMMQKEVGERILAPPGARERGSLSVYLQAQFEIERVAKAPAGAFIPPPKVDSLVLAFRPKPLALHEEARRKLFKLIRAGFAQPRKTLVNNLIGMGVGREAAVQAVGKLGVDERIRPQELTLDQWLELSQAIG